MIKGNFSKSDYTTCFSCRICGNSSLKDVADLGTHYVNNFVEEEDHSKYPKAPLELVRCDSCSLIQLRHTAPQEILYSRFYWYRSGVTDMMKLALEDIVKYSMNIVTLEKGDIVLDIGSNDGTLLRQYPSSLDIFKIGVEPATNLKEEGSRGVDHLIEDFWQLSSFEQVTKKKAKIITAIGMFYDLEDPNQFIADAYAALADGGIFVTQLMCLKNMIETRDLGNINHEHLEYYTLESLKYLFEKNGLEIIDIQKNDVNNGSFRIATRKIGDSLVDIVSQDRIDQYFAEECSEEEINNFFKSIEDEKSKCLSFIKEAKAQGKSVWVYGASTKGNTILQYYGLDSSLIDGAAERSPEKWGKYTIGSKIKCYSEDEARKVQPDYFLVLPYTFIEEMYERESEWRHKGGKFIVPLPNFRILE